MAVEEAVFFGTTAPQLSEIGVIKKGALLEGHRHEGGKGYFHNFP